MRQSGVYLFVLALSTTIDANAETWRVGPMLGGAQASIEDPDGPTADASTFYPGVAIVFDSGRDTRFFGELYRHSFDLAPSTSDIGQAVTRTGANISMQKLFRASRSWKPWVGLGLGYSQDEFTSRQTIDRDGFLARRFPNLAENALNVVANASSEWQVSKDWEVGLHLQYQAPLNGNVRALSLSVMFLY